MKLTAYRDFINESRLDDKLELINNSFEPSHSIFEFTVRDEEFMELARSSTSDYKEFIELIRSRLLQLAQETEKEGPNSENVKYLADIISSHPRIGETKNLSIHSQNEQKNLQKSQDPPEIQRKLRELNDQYEKVYPQLKFIIFVNGRKRPEIIKVMEERILSGNTWFEEAKVAINELCDIAQDRIKKWSTDTFKSKY